MGYPVRCFQAQKKTSLSLPSSLAIKEHPSVSVLHKQNGQHGDGHFPPGCPVQLQNNVLGELVC